MAGASGSTRAPFAPDAVDPAWILASWRSLSGAAAPSRPISRPSFSSICVMGVEPRPGEEPCFGETATAILEKSDRSIVFVVS